MIVSLSVTTPARQFEFRLALDTAHLSHSYILEELQGDQLYEHDAARVLASVLQPGDTFIDVGAHIGYFTMLAAAIVGPTGRAIAFEPERENYARLLRNAELNAGAPILPVHMAVGDRERVADFYVNSDNDGGHALWDVGEHPFNERSRQVQERRPVWVTTLDRFLAASGSGRVAAIKIDTEGNDLAVLRGAEQTLRAHGPAVIAEVNPFGLERLGASERAMREYMCGLGYECYLLMPGRDVLPRVDLTATLESSHVFNLLFIR